MQIIRIGSQPYIKGPADWFTNQVRIDYLFSPEAPAHVSAGHVNFEPGARTNWHKHPVGQMLIVTAGKGLVQRDGGPVEEIHAGDIVWFAPEERHWHGAAADTAMSHIAIQESADGKSVDWLEPVTDAQYGA